MGEATLGPSVTFMALQLEIAIASRPSVAEQPPADVFGDLTHEPARTWAERSPAELLDAVGGPA